MNINDVGLFSLHSYGILIFLADATFPPEYDKQTGC